MSFDHGVLNLPLSQRGDIDRQIDAHKAALKRDAKAERQQFIADRAAAKAAVAASVNRLILNFMKPLVLKKGNYATRHKLMPMGYPLLPKTIRGHAKGLA